MKRTKRTNKQATKPTITAKQALPDKVPVAAHLREIKRRFFYVAISIIVCAAAMFSIEQKLINALLLPSHGQHFVYTSPMGGINFLFNVCLYFAVALSAPVIIYNLLQFIRPLMQRTTQRFILSVSIISGLIAIGGIIFGYYAGLPAALHFLLREQFHGAQVAALISIEKYFSFVVAYMFGAALMFQLPLILVIINHIRPITPRKMLKYERAIIAFSFVVAFIMNPTPNIIDQMLTVIPMLISYQLGIVLVWNMNRRNLRRRYSTLFAKDQATREDRLQRAQMAYVLPTEALRPAPVEPIRLVDIDSVIMPSRKSAIENAMTASTRARNYISPTARYASAASGRLLQM